MARKKPDAKEEVKTPEASVTETPTQGEPNVWNKDIIVTQEQAMQLQKECKMVGYYEKIIEQDGKKTIERHALIR